MDIRERTIQLLVRALLHSAQVLVHLTDAYARRSLEDAIQECLTAAINTDSAPDALADAVSQLHKCIEDSGAGDGVPLRTLLLAERHVLLLLVHSKAFPKPEKPRAPKRHDSGNSITEALPTAGKGRLTDTLQSVLDGVKQVQPARAKEVIQKCATLSERTVMRSLKQLADKGFLVRDNSEGAVLYRIVGA